MNGTKILVAEDDVDLNKMIVRKFTAEGNAVDVYISYLRKRSTRDLMLS